MTKGVLLGLALYAGFWVLLSLGLWIGFSVSEWRERLRCEREQLLRLWYTILLSGEMPFTIYQNEYRDVELEFPPGAISQEDPGGVRLVRLNGSHAGEILDGK